MGIADRFKNPEKYRGARREKPPLEKDFGNGEASDAWFIAWEVYELYPLNTDNRQLRSFGSEIFTFPTGEAPKVILQMVRDSLGRHLGLGNVTRLEIDSGDLVSKEYPNPNIHITQFNKL